MWKFEHDLPYGERVMKGKYQIVVEGTPDMWYVDEANKFMTYNEAKLYYPNSPLRTHSSKPIHSFKAFERFLYKHGDTLKGHTPILLSNVWRVSDEGVYNHCNIVAQYKEN